MIFLVVCSNYLEVEISFLIEYHMVLLHSILVLYLFEIQVLFSMHCFLSLFFFFNGSRTHDSIFIYIKKVGLNGTRFYEEVEATFDLGNECKSFVHGIS